MDIISKALEVGEDYPVFPCDIKKRPVCQGGFKAATQDPDEIERLFSIKGAALIGVPTGEASGLAVIDIDVRDGKKGKQWWEDNAELLQNTRISETQSTGRHYYYKHRDGLRNRAGIDGCVDVRAEGGYVVYPESTGYRWLNDEELAEFPERVAAQATGVAAASLDVPMGSDAFDAFGRRVDGREHYMASMVLASISDYFRKHGTFPTMQWMEQEVYPTYEIKVGSRIGDLNAEGRGIDEFRKKVTSTIIRAREGKIADIHIAPDKAQPAVSHATSDTPLPRPIERQIKIRTLGELRSTPPPSFLVADYLIENTFAVLYGAPASYKSFVAMDWALSIAHGVDWNDRPVAQGAVLYLAMEGQAGIATRAEAWHRERGLEDTDVPFYAVTQPIGMAMPDAPDVTLLKNSIDEVLGGVKPSLICCDTLARSFSSSGGAEENSATDMGMFVRSADLLREWYDCTFLTVHHVSKAGGMRGSSALLGAVDTAMECRREPDSDKMKLVVTKQKDVGESDELWLEAKEVRFVQDAFAQEQSSLVLEPSDKPKRKVAKPSQAKETALEVLRELLASEHREDDGEVWGVPEDVFRHALNERYKEKYGKTFYRADWKRVTGSVTEGVTDAWEEFVRFNNGLINESW
jgi:hypothetical protein